MRWLPISQAAIELGVSEEWLELRIATQELQHRSVPLDLGGGRCHIQGQVEMEGCLAHQAQEVVRALVPDFTWAER